MNFNFDPGSINLTLLHSYHKLITLQRIPAEDNKGLKDSHMIC